MATLAPTAGPALILPLMIVSSGNGTWLVMLLATLAVICIGREINTFARRYSSPGSLYTFVAEGLPRAAIPAAWALLFAYLGTGISCAVGAVIYSYSLFFPHVAIARGGVVLIAVVSVTTCSLLAWFDVRFSTRLMLGLEVISVATILLLFVLPGHGNELHLDRVQLLLSGVTLHQLRGGLVLGVFAFAGHTESVASAVTPLKLLADLRGYPMLAPMLVALCIISALAGMTGCIQAAARTLYRMSRDGQCAAVLGRAHARRQSSHIAIVACSGVILAVPIGLTMLGTAPLDIYGWLATFGFLTAYGLVTIASVRLQMRTLSFSVVSAGSVVVIACVLALCVSSCFDASATMVYRVRPYGCVVVLGVSVMLTLLLRKTPSVGKSSEERLDRELI